MLQVVLVAPEIAANTGNIIRLCANTGAALHLVEPLGFTLDEPRLRRAGLDYHELTDVSCHRSIEACLRSLAARPERRFALSGRGERRFDEVRYQHGDVVVFGAERAGLDGATLARFAPSQQLRIPMRPANRSLNLANAVAVVLYEAWRQAGFVGQAEASGAGGDGAASLAETTAAEPFDRAKSPPGDDGSTPSVPGRP